MSEITPDIWGKQSVTVKDPLGRELVIESMNVLEQSRLYKAIGSADSGNEAFVRTATMACMIKSIDGVKYIMPKTPAEVEAAIARMGDASYVTVMLTWQKWVSETNDRFDSAREAFQESVKN